MYFSLQTAEAFDEFAAIEASHLYIVDVIEWWEEVALVASNLDKISHVDDIFLVHLNKVGAGGEQRVAVYGAFEVYGLVDAC